MSRCGRPPGKALAPIKPPIGRREIGQDSDFAVTIKVRNGRFLAALQRAGYRSVSAFCKAHGLPLWPVNDFVRMVKSPLHNGGDNRGRPNALAQACADILNVQVEDLFPPRFLATCLSRAAKTDDLPMTEDQIGMLIQQPPRTPEDIIALDEAAARISDTLILLPPREERVLRLRFGMGTREEKTLGECGDQLGVTRERIRQMEIRALRKLTGPSRKGRLVEPAATLEIGRFKIIPPVPRSASDQRAAGIRPATAAYEHAAKPKPPPVERPAQPLRRRVQFPTQPRLPEYQRLLRIHPDNRTRETKLQLAYYLEAELQRRGMGKLRPATPETAELDEIEMELAKYEWLITNLATLFTRYPDPDPMAAYMSEAEWEEA